MFKLLICLCVLFLVKSMSSTPVNKQETTMNPMLGPVNVPVSDPEIQKFAKLSLEVYAQKLKNKSYEPIIYSIMNATEATVAGVLYEMKIKFGESTCPKGQKINCAVKNNGETEDYKAEVYTRPWIDNDVPLVTLTRL